MKNLKTVLFASLLSISTSCFVTNYQEKGNVLSEKFNYETSFTTLKTILIIPSEINGISKNFFFDNRVQLSII
jgi:hypothetical protein